MSPTVDGLDVSVFTVPTDGPDGRESDGTLEWDSTTCVVVQAHAGGQTGLGYTYGPGATPPTSGTRWPASPAAAIRCGREQLQAQLAGWVAQGIPRVKMKVGRDPAADRDRVRWAREAIGDDTELLVDANGAYSPEQARAWARWFAEQGAVWLEEPLCSDDLAGLAELRHAAPPGLAITAGEYGWDLLHFQRLLEHDAVDVVQPDVTRCGGYTSFLRVDALCRARNRALSAHCAPAQSVHAVCACETAVHIEYFHDHTRIESMLFDGVLDPQPGGRLVPDRSRPGNGLELKARAAS